MAPVMTLTLWTLFLIPAALSGKTVMDLTWTLSPSTLYWPGNPDFNFTILTREQFEKYWYEANWFGTPEHGGTHLDCPSHFWKGGWKCHEIPAERLIGPAVVIDVTSKVKANADYRVTPMDIEEYEHYYGMIPKGAIVIMNSGWGSRYPNKSLTFNTATPKDPTTFHFPGFHEDAVSWLAAYRDVNMVGVDTPSVDYGQSRDFKAHVILGKHNIPILENVAHVEQLPASGASIFVGSVKLHDGSGSPVRILATMDKDACDCRTSAGTYVKAKTMKHLLLISLFFLLKFKL